MSNGFLCALLGINKKNLLFNVLLIHELIPAEDYSALCNVEMFIFLIMFLDLRLNLEKHQVKVSYICYFIIFLYCFTNEIIRNA